MTKTTTRTLRKVALVLTVVLVLLNVARYTGVRVHVQTDGLILRQHNSASDASTQPISPTVRTKKDFKRYKRIWSAIPTNRFLGNVSFGLRNLMKDVCIKTFYI